MQKFSNTKYDHTRLISNTKDAYGHIRFAQNTMDEHNNKGVHINIMKHAITQKEKLDRPKAPNKMRMGLTLDTKQGEA